MYAENAPANLTNEEILSSVDGTLIGMKAIDVLLENIQCSEKVLDILKTVKSGETGNLTYLLRLKVRVMFISNIDTDDLLINGEIGS